MAKSLKKKKLSLFFKIIFLINLMFAIALIASLLAKVIEPSIFIYFSFLGLAYPILLYVNLGFVVIWVLKRHKFFLISVVAILITFTNIPKYIQFSSKEKVNTVKEDKLTVVSFNVKAFNSFYNHNSTDYLDSLANFLLEIDADIVCFQDFYNDNHMEVQITKYLKEKLQFPYYHFNRHLVNFDRYEFGIATFSKYPIINKGRIENINIKDHSLSQNYCIYTDIVVLNDTIRVYNAHLESNRVSSEKLMIQEFEQVEKSTLHAQVKNIIVKLKNAFIARSKQVAPIIEHINQAPYSVILCGDFNDTPFSWTYRQLSNNMQDAFIVAGKGTGKTYTGNYFSFRIDYILVDSNFVVHQFETPNKEFSDHLPVYTVISKKTIADTSKIEN